ncbi:acyl carrier protein [Streptosporangium sp. G11]|uniref:acyl carrier protein n=1 Tax=Streptosporangium sp. G11 TaxID=3436926 RepID=UPI003EBD91FD
MDRQQHLEILREVASEVLAVDPDALVEEARFREDLDADSLDLIELITAIEDRFGLRFSDGALKDISTVSQALDIIDDHAAQTDAI